MDTEPRPAPPETWISVDVETSGPAPGVASLLSIGAQVLWRPDQTFSVELRPLPGTVWIETAQDVHGLTRDYLDEHGLEPREAMTRFADWIGALPTVANGARPVFVGFNAPFDWMFVADYFWRFTGANPFGVSALDIKSLYLGRAWPEVSAWVDTTRTKILARHPRLTGDPLSHDALDDARQQAELLERLLDAANPSDG